MQIKPLTPTATIPQYQTHGAAGFDLHADEDTVIMGGSRRLISTGLAMAVPLGTMLRVCPRSGLAVKGIDVGAGVVDADYRGEVKVLLINTGIDLFTVKRGDRIAQGVVLPVTLVAFDVVDDLDETQRGSGGFGSTGI